MIDAELLVPAHNGVAIRGHGNGCSSTREGRGVCVLGLAAEHQLGRTLRSQDDRDKSSVKKRLILDINCQ